VRVWGTASDDVTWELGVPARTRAAAPAPRRRVRGSGL